MFAPWLLAARYIGQGAVKLFTIMSDRVDEITAARAERTVAQMSERERHDHYIRDAEQHRARKEHEELAAARKRVFLVVFFAVIAVSALLIIAHTTNSRNAQTTQIQAQEQLRMTLATIFKAGLNRAFLLAKQYPKCTGEEKSSCPSFHEQMINLCSGMGQSKADGTGPTAECDIEPQLRLWTEHAALALQYDECISDGDQAPEQCNRVISVFRRLLQACEDPGDPVFSDCPEITKHYRNLPLK